MRLKFNPNRRLIVTVIFFLFLYPMFNLFFDILNARLGTNPVAELVSASGIWSFQYIYLLLCVFLLQQYSAWFKDAALQKCLLLICLIYSSLHLLVNVVFEYALNIGQMREALSINNNISVGLTAYVFLIVTACLLFSHRSGGHYKLMYQSHIFIVLFSGLHMLLAAREWQNNFYWYAGVFVFIVRLKIVKRVLQ